MDRITKRKRSVYEEQGQETYTPINRIANEVEGKNSDPHKSVFGNLRDHTFFRGQWTEDLDMVVIDTLYEDFVKKNWRTPYKVTDNIILDARSNIKRIYKILMMDEHISERVREFKKAVKAVTEITQLGDFYWCNDRKMIIGDKDNWKKVIEKMNYYILFKNISIPYYPGKLVDIFS